MKFKFLYFLVFITIINYPAFAQWKKITSIPSPFTGIYWLDVYFLESNPNFGWICGYGGNVIRTTDGGLTWQGSQVTKMIIDSSGRIGNKTIYDTTRIVMPDQLESVHFATEKIGYTSGSDNVFKTTDGGLTWDLVSDDSMQAWGVFAVSQDTCFAMGGGCDTKMQFEKTTNGGKTWRSFNVNSLMSGLTDSMINRKTGICYASSSGYIWISKDLGNTWSVLSKTGGEDWQEEITNVGNSFLVPWTQYCAGGGKTGGMRISTDYGKTWKQYTTGSAMFGSFLNSDKKGWAVGQKSSIYYTSDGGGTWESRNCGLGPNANLDDIWFINDSLGWVVGTEVYKTFYFDTSRAKIQSDKPLKICIGDSIMLKSDKPYQYYKWSTGDTSNFIYVTNPGFYSLEAYNSLCEFKVPDSVKIEFYPKTDVNIASNKAPEICFGDSVKIWVTTEHKDVVWSTLEKTDTIIVKTNGTYTVSIIDTNGCEYTKSIDVIVHPNPNLEIQEMGRLQFCVGDSVILATKDKYSSYKWSETSDPNNILSTQDEVKIFQSGNYNVIVKNQWGCIDTSKIVTVEVWKITNNFVLQSYDNNKYINFDTLNLGNIDCRQLKFTNISYASLWIDNIYVLHNTEFSIPQKQFPFKIEPNETINIDVCFRPVQSGMRRDTLIFNDTCKTHNIPVFGVGKGNTYYGNADCGVVLKFESTSIIDGSYYHFNQPYPNPSSGYFTLNIDGIPKDFSGEPEIKICNDYGTPQTFSMQSTFKTDSDNNRNLSISVQCESMESGIYYASIRFGSLIKTMPVIIIK